MKYLIGLYNRNRKKIWIILGSIVAVYVIIHIINNFLGHNLYTAEKNQIEKKEIFYKTNYSVISKEEIKTQSSDENISFIKSFINYCNEQKIDEAYNMLSDDCKEYLFPTIDIFNKNYYEKYFNKTKTFNILSWIVEKNKYIYRVEIMEDILETGKTSSNKSIDYYTVVIDNDNNLSLNIAGYVETKNVGIYGENEVLKINVVKEEIFVDYLYIDINVQNKTRNDVLLDSGKSGDSVYIVDENENTYASYLFEVIENNLVIRKNGSKEFKLKFQKEFNNNININKIAFLDIVSDYGTNDVQGQNKLIIELMNNK